MSLEIAPLRLPEPGPRYERENEAQTRRALADIISAVVAAASSSSGSGSSTLAGLTDVNLTTPANGAALVYDNASSKWIDGGVPLSSPIDQSDVTNLVSDLAAKAPLASPAFTGTPTAPTPAASDNDTSIATTAYVQTELASFSPAAAPAMPVGHAGTTGMECWYACGQLTNASPAGVSLTAGSLYAIPFVPPSRGGTMDKFAVHVSSTAAAKSIKVAIYDTDGVTNFYPNSKLFEATFSVASAARVEATQSYTFTPGRVYWAAILVEANCGIYGFGAASFNPVCGLTPGAGIGGQGWVVNSRAYASGFEATWSAALNWVYTGSYHAVLIRYSS